MKKNKSYSIPRLIMIIGHHLKGRMDKSLNQNNLTISQFRVLSYLWKHRGKKINQKMIHDFLEIKPSSLTKLIRILTQKGLIKKTVDSEDARNKIILLTEKGERIKNICLQNIIESEIYLLKDFSSPEIEALTNLLLKIKSRIKSQS